MQNPTAPALLLSGRENVEMWLVAYEVRIGYSDFIESLFITDSEEFQANLGKTVQFDEKNFVSILEEADFRIISKDQAYVQKTHEIFDSWRMCGLCPYDYLLESEKENNEGE